MGRSKRLFSHLSFSRGLKCFDFDVLTLSARGQFKLFTSILSDYHEPKYTVPFLLPLINSSNELVKEALLSRLELLTQDYGNDLTDVLKIEWKEMTVEQEKMYDRIKKYEVDFYNKYRPKII